MALVRKLKKVNEIIPGWAKVPFSPVLRKQLIGNIEFRKQYGELLGLDGMPKGQAVREQEEKLREALQYAYSESAFYKRIMDENHIDPSSGNPYSNLKKMPLLTKEILKENLGEISVPSVTDFYEVTTGGTTGEPTKIYMAGDAIYKEWAFVYHYWSKYGYDYKKSKLATFRGVGMGNKIYEINPLYQEIRMNVFAMNRNNIGKYVKAIERYGADFVYGYPSAVYNFCRLLQGAGIKQEGRYRAVLLISENLYPFQEEKITEVLNAPIAMFYGHSERAVFGEGFGGGYTFNPFYGITEISDMGEPVVTSFINKKTPLIRYVVDDQVKKIELNSHGAEGPGNLEGCYGNKLGFGINTPDRGIALVDGVYGITGHRDSGFLYGANGEIISAAAINFHDNTFDGISAYQFIQEEPGECVIRIVPDGPLTESKRTLIKKRVCEKLGSGISCDVEPVKEISLTSRGKYRLIIQNMGMAPNKIGIP